MRLAFVLFVTLTAPCHGAREARNKVAHDENNERKPDGVRAPFEIGDTLRFKSDKLSNSIKQKDHPGSQRVDFNTNFNVMFKALMYVKRFNVPLIVKKVHDLGYGYLYDVESEDTLDGMGYPVVSDQENTGGVLRKDEKLEFNEVPSYDLQPCRVGGDGKHYCMLE